MDSQLFPFTAIVGQSQLRLALTLLAISPRIGGVLIRGEKGTAKSTAARSLARLLPSGQLRTLALGATADRVLGGLDLEATLATGEPQLQPGLLAGCNGGIVYIDEVNLLDEHLTGLVLDAAASGVVRIEREGLSITQPAEFALVGTMNPEEGSLRPQLLDRFGLCVDVVGQTAVAERVEILERRLAFDADPAGFAARWAAPEAQLATRLRVARQLAPAVKLDSQLRAEISDRCLAANVLGHRADLVFARSAQAHAAWSGRNAVTSDDIEAVADLVLAHRARPTSPEAESPPPRPAGARQQRPDEPPREPDDGSSALPRALAAGSAGPPDQVAEPGETFRVRALDARQERCVSSKSGRRQLSRSNQHRGHVIGSRVTSRADDLALDATIRAAAPHQLARRGTLTADDPRTLLAVLINQDDWLAKTRQQRTGSGVVLVVDASGSMGARNRMVASKGAVLSLLLDAYVKRDQVGLVSFRGAQAQVLVPLTTSVDLAQQRLRELPVGGRTPLSAGLLTGQQVSRPLLVKDPGARPLIVVITDGRGNVDLKGVVCREATTEALDLARQLAASEPRIGWVVVDSEPTGHGQQGCARELADALKAQYFTIEQLRADDLFSVVQRARDQLALANPR